MSWKNWAQIVVSGLILGSAVPLVFVLAASALYFKFAWYAPPFFYPLFFVVGAGGKWIDLKKRPRPEGKK
ncbi:MAG TPA: hypothetical protein VG942_17760 [Hyphomonadaceae bacterium]|nr:hypothetical protein [Hyphomonadaceae bacterium]